MKKLFTIIALSFLFIGVSKAQSPYYELVFNYKFPDGTRYVFSSKNYENTVILMAGEAPDRETLVLPTHVSFEGVDYEVTGIGSNAFMKRYGGEDPLRGVKELIVPEGYTSTDIGCFRGCPDLEKIYLPSSLRNIAPEMFFYCENLKEVIIPDDNCLYVIGDQAFKGCDSLEYFKISSNVEIMGESPWKECKNLKAFEVSPDNPYFKVENGALYHVDGTLIQYPEGKKD